MAGFLVRGSPKTTARERRAVQLASIASTYLSGSAIVVPTVASASTINLNYATGEIVTITGTVTITAISTAAKVNELRRVLFADSLILTHNSSTLVLPTGANITTAANDYAEFISTSTGWFCSLYRLANGTILGVVPITLGGTGATTAPDAVKNVVVNILPAGGRIGGTTAVSDDTAITNITYFPFVGDNAPLYTIGGVAFNATFTGPTLALTGVISCTTVNASPTVTTTDTFTHYLIPGMLVSGTGISGGTTVSSVDSDTQITLSANATASGTNDLTFKVPANKNVDVFLVQSTINGTTLMQLGALWGSDTVRANNLTLRTEGFYTTTNASDLQGTRATFGTYVGTIRTTSTDGQTETSTSRRFIWNAFNRLPRPVSAVDATNTWNYSTAAYQQANANTANKFEVVQGIANDDIISAHVFHSVVNNSATARNIRVGIGLDSTTVNSAVIWDGIAVALTRVQPKAMYTGFITTSGYHYFAWLEYGAGTADTQTWHGDNGGVLQSGMCGTVYC